MFKSATIAHFAAVQLALERGRALKVMICFSHLRWDFVFQRPQHLLIRASRDHLVFYFEEPVARRTCAAFLSMKDRDGVIVATPIIPDAEDGQKSDEQQKSLLADLLDQIHKMLPDAPLIFWYYTPMALSFSAWRHPDLCIYDCMDELSAFRGAPRQMIEREHELIGRTDLMFTGGVSLYQAKRTLHTNIHLFPSSIDRRHFAQAREPRADPPDQAGIKRPRVGFFGVIDERMDLNLIANIADLAPQWQLVMIGPVVKIDPATLPKRPNIHWLSAKAYDALPAYLSGWNLGFMPFALDETTRFISPTKTPEFLAAGLPLLSTAVPDVVRAYRENGLVAIIHSAAQAVAVGEVLMKTDRHARLRATDEFLAGLSWDVTWAGMYNLMAEALRSNSSNKENARGVFRESFSGV